MQLKITNTKEQPLLFRSEITAEGITDALTPSKVDTQKLIANESKCSENLIVIDNIKTFFGSRKIKITAYKYKDEDSLKKIEPKKKEKKEKAPKTKKAEAK